MEKLKKKLRLKVLNPPDNDEGFTLIEALISLFVVSLSLFLMNSLLLNIQTVIPKIDHQKQAEWHVFLHQLPYEIEGYQLELADNRELLFTSDEGSKIYIYLRNGRVVKQVNYEGHQPLLMDVKSIQYQNYEENLINVNVEFLTGEQYAAVLPIEKREESSEKE
ncbi:MAG: competence type IV pilus minor pilin ComGF [Atopococcus tabaci]|uniref:Competence type IV pilus minor pilin ComGF n=1 Tax=Atopococcus tabaci TaxID=269774 RepID=A0AA43UBQ1_9LACT|nr:competence type IV pilus minor pilin ComGF [Atopococcus tabaci]